MKFKALFILLGILAMPAMATIDTDVEGNHFYRAGKINEVLASDPEAYTEDGLNAWKDDAVFYVGDLYRKQGFFDIAVTVELQKTGKGEQDWHALLNLNEGPRFTFDTVSVVEIADSTESIIPRQSAQSIATDDLSAQVGKPYREDFVFRDKRYLLQRYGDAGYVRARIENKIEVKTASKTVQIDYWVTPSYPVIFDTLILDNRRAPPADTLLGLTRQGLLRSLVHYERGDTVRISQNDNLIAKLQYTGAFRFVRLKDSLEAGDNHGSAIFLNSEERIPGHLRSSLFWESQYGPGISFEARHSNIAGTLNEVRGGTAIARERQNIFAGCGSPLTLGYLIRFDNDLTFDWYQDKAVHLHEMPFGGDFRAANSARLTWPWSYWLHLSSNAELETKSRMLDENGSRERSLSLNFIQTAFFAFLNQAMDPSRGTRFALSWGNGGPLLEDRTFRFAEFRHNWFEAQTGYYYYLPPWDAVSFALRIDGGRFFGQGGTNSDRFFLGGGRNVRSYGYQELCPESHIAVEDSSRTVCSTDHLTAAYVLTSIEMRLAPFATGFVNPNGKWKTIIPLKFVPFYDFGKVWNVPEGFSLNSQQQGQGEAFGLGFRYPLLGIFNLRIDLAYGAPGNGRWPDRWVIDLAQAF
jgi:outer membrane protein assembly factor BamA